MSLRSPAGYPSKKRLTEADQNNVLRHGPDPKWFEPWAERGVNMSDATEASYGYFHIYSQDGAFNYDFAAWPTEQGLRWGLDALWERHHKPDPNGFPQCTDCRSVMYFMPDELPRMYGVVEADDPEDEGVEQ